MVVPEEEGVQRVVEMDNGKEMRISPEVLSIRDKEVPERNEKLVFG
jgi:hypothetical protein